MFDLPQNGAAGSGCDAANIEGSELPLFRSEVLEARSGQWMGRITLPQPISYWFLTLLVFVFAAAVVVFLSVATYTRHESAQGQLIASPAVVPVVVNSAGTIRAKHVHEGQHVIKNQALVELSEGARDSQEAIVLHAPQDGVVVDLLAEVGKTVTAGERVLSIVPAAALLKAEFWLPTRAIGFLKTGDVAVLHSPAFPYQKFGQQLGHVSEVAQSATSISELTNLLGRPVGEPLFRVLIELDRQAVSAYGKEEPLKCGMTVDVDILLEQRRLIEWVLEPFFRVSRTHQKPILAKPEENSRR